MVEPSSIKKDVRVVLSGSVSHAKRKPASLLGKNFSVLPATMMVEGAYYPYVEHLNDAHSLHFAGSDLMQSVNTWNGRPVAINHPEGTTTCNSPENYNKQWIGYVFNSRYEQDTKSLKADLWIDDERGSAINDMVLSGKNLEVSIGAFGDLKPFRGTAGHDFSMTNIVGDHLAILPDSKGACSWEDGCGVRASVFCRQIAAVRSSARTPAYDGVETSSWGDVTKSLEAYVKAYYREKGINQPKEVSSTDTKGIPSAVKTWIASKTLLGDSKADTARDLLFFPVVNPKTNKLNEGALRAVLSGRGAQADISEEARTSAMNKAKSLLESKFNKSVTMRGEKVPECKEEKVANQKDCLEVKAESKKEEKVKGEAPFNTEQWLNQAPPNFRNYLVNSMKSYDTMRQNHINKILACKSAVFCEKALNNLEDMGLMESISALVDVVNTAPAEAEDRKVVGMQNYQLKASGNGVQEKQLDYAPFTDIDYVEMQKERLEMERRRYGR